MAKKGALFKLIKSLSKAEKRYFRIFSGHSGDSKNYLKVFNFIEEQEEENDVAIKEQFQARRFGRQLHVTKHYLTKIILKSLRNYHTSTNVKTKLYEALVDIEILYKKELYDICDATIAKARKMACEYERFHELLEILNWERRLLVSRHGTLKAHDEIYQLIQEETEVIEKLKNHNEYQTLTYEMFTYDFSNRSLLEQVRQHPLLATPERALSFAAKTLYHHTLYALNTLCGKSAEAQQAISHLIYMFEENSHRIMDNPEAYVTVLNNKMAALLQRRETEEAVALLKKIRKVPAQYKMKDDHYTLKVFLKTYNAELELYRDIKDWRNGDILINEIKSFIDHYRESIAGGYLISFYYQFAYIHFMQKEFSKSLAALNEIIGRMGEERADIQSYARFLLLIIHYELKNIIVLKYAVESTRRYLKKRKGKVQHFEIILLRFFSKLSTVPSGDHGRLFERIQGELFLQLNEDQKKHVIDYLDFESWIASKIN